MKGKKAIASKFPTARIKKIMQEDEEIGKVAQGTPIVISRALELLLKDMIVETADIARTSGSKKLQPWHVKRLVAQNRQYDFLDELVESVSDPTAGAESGIAGTTTEGKPNGRGKGRANGGKASPALKANASTPSSSSTPVAAAAAPTVDSGARAPVVSSLVGVISAPVGMGPITIPQHTAYGSGKGPSNASIILNSPTAPVMGSMGSSSAKPAAKPEHDFDDYDEEDDDEDDDYDA